MLASPESVITQDNKYAAWQKLCEEYDVANDACSGVLGEVNQKFAAISCISNDELSKIEKAWKELEDIERRMEDF